jgi:hypothetical protein
LLFKSNSIWKKYQLVWKIPITILLPTVGLLANNGYLYGQESSGFIGDFQNHWFYILMVLNGILICLPSIERKMYRLLLFIARNVMFSFSLYFLLVLLPFLPISILTIIFFGFGFLLLCPLLIFVIHVYEISIDYQFLKNFYTIRTLYISSLGFFLIPIIVTISYYNDKLVLNETLAYVYSPNYAKQKKIDKISLQNTLNVVKSHKNRRGDGWLFNDKKPYLSSYYNWIILDNLTLSDAKINTIERIFFDTDFNFSQEIDNPKDNVKISNISARSVYDASQKCWKSWIDLEITNRSLNDRFSEYTTTFQLPEGCWITDYYLFVGDKKESGILADKKSALWVFSNIRNENKDPGILYYLTANKVAFKVFPFAKNEIRKTGIEFLHKEPVGINIDNNIVRLGNEKSQYNGRIETENVLLVSALEKQLLNKVQRVPYFHFIVDISYEKQKHNSEFIKRIETFLQNNPKYSKNAQISFTNSYVQTYNFDFTWEKNTNCKTLKVVFISRGQ